MALFGLAAKLLLSVALWPLAACLGWALAKLCWGLPWTTGRLPWFAGGFAAYLLVQALFWRPLFLYVMGHELTHALAAVLQGGQADDLRVSTKGGMVKVNKSNFLVNLAPYFFPLYTALALAVWAVAAEAFKPALAGLVGFSLAFHYALTAYSLKQHQSDIHEVGWLFAIPFILALNAIISATVLRAIVGPAVDLGSYFKDTGSALAGSAAWIRARL